MTAERISATLLLAVLCAWATTTARAAEPPHEYRISVDAGLDTMRVEARFHAPVSRIRAGGRRAVRYIGQPRICDSGARLGVDGRNLELPRAGIRCLTYTVDLERAARDERRNRELDGQSRIVSPSNWMWRPELDDEATIRATFHLPEGTRVALPWTPVPGGSDVFELRASPESADGPAVFGEFDYHEVSLGDAALRVALPAAARPVDTGTVLAWLEATARDVSLTYGRFPNPSPFVLVLPVSGERSWRSRSPVPFGRVTRNGGESVELIVDPDQPLSAYLDDWTATHEFSHLMVPYLDSEARWISEGFAQYYQNVLLARSGAYEPERAWKKIHDGLERGRATLPALSPNEAARERSRGGRMKVYWAGAALALLADVELRQRSGGRASLDTALERLQTCCLPSGKTWSGLEFVDKLDELIDGEPVFAPLYEAWANTPGFPDTASVLDRLGVAVSGETAVFRATAPLAGTRNAITRRHAATAAWRQRLAAD